ncbi:LysR substrate-binding domain-containing protein [Thalassolituus sp. LLYu03]|uniref:LysR substrate-binding domain-containing protein n=1 Tax=Thalassolituus sp. LLYu03 TaxID=3421656 RepID=UPI003D2CA95C
MKDLNAMRVFLQVAEQKSFSAAADALGLPRSSVSAAVQQLEAELGTRLLMRTTRRVDITAEGEHFMRRARELLADMDELQNLFHSGQQTLSGVVRVDMPVPLARDHVIPRLSEFQQRYPGIQLELSCTDRRVDPLAEGFDLVVRVGELSDSSLIARRLGVHRMVNCASPDYIARFGMPASLADLSGHRLVGYSQSLGRHGNRFEYVNAAGQVAFVEMAQSICVNNVEAYTAACLAGLGIIQSPRLGVQALIDAGRLLPVLPGSEAAPMPVSLLYPERRFLSQRVRVFMDWLDDLLRPGLTP